MTLVVILIVFALHKIFSIEDEFNERYLFYLLDMLGK